MSLNKTDYSNKTKEILQDDSKYKELNGDWLKIVLKLEDKYIAQNCIRRYLKKNHLALALIFYLHQVYYQGYYMVHPNVTSKDVL